MTKYHLNWHEHVLYIGRLCFCCFVGRKASTF